MRQFQYYLYDNSEITRLGLRTDDPRRFLNEKADGVLSDVVNMLPGKCGYTSLCQAHSSALIDSLIQIGLLRRCDDVIFLDSTVIVAQDVETLANCFTAPISRMANRLEQNKQAFVGAVQHLNNGFPPDVNLYHLLCGHVLDGLFFDYLAQNKVVSTSRMHDSGMDYIITVYEDSPVLDAFAKKLLCSYNRYTDGSRALQSFGDSQGSRVDFYRFAVQKALGAVPSSLKEMERAWDLADCDHHKSLLLDAAQIFAETGQCEAPYMQLLSFFGYAQDGTITVPVYTKEHLPVIHTVEQLAETLLYADMETALSAAGKQLPLLCGKYGVAPGEIANELYHIMFGQLNEELVARKFVAEPAYRPMEGRYLQSIELL